VAAAEKAGGDDDGDDYDEVIPDKNPESSAGQVADVALRLLRSSYWRWWWCSRVTGWWGPHHQSHQADEHRCSSARSPQGALNLTTIDWRSDRTCSASWDSATGTFYEIRERAQPSSKSSSRPQSSRRHIRRGGIGVRIPKTGLRCRRVTVKTSHAGAPNNPPPPTKKTPPAPRAWRMRIFVQKVGDEAKVSSLEFRREQTHLRRPQGKHMATGRPTPIPTTPTTPSKQGCLGSTKRPTSRGRPPTRHRSPLTEKSPSGTAKKKKKMARVFAFGVLPRGAAAGVGAGT